MITMDWKLRRETVFNWIAAAISLLSLFVSGLLLGSVRN